jgi:hypothetical protein
MKFDYIKLSRLQSRVVLNIQKILNYLKIYTQRRFPDLFGLPTQGPYLQLYREDNFFKTKISIFNYCSTFQGNKDVKLDYRITIFDRNGVETGFGKIILENGESLQEYLSDLIVGYLDNYGLFSVMATPITDDVAELNKLGVTTCQFMTIYYPTDRHRQAPQIIHSHKLFQNFRLPKTTVVRESNITEDFSYQDLTEFYLLNSCRSAIKIELYILDINTGHELITQKIIIPGHGVGLFELRSTDISEENSKAAFRYTFDRSISHQKPIVFRHQKNKVINCNHS